MLGSTRSDDRDAPLQNLVLRSIKISGFRDSPRDIELDLERDANFLIGQNGTGKTTLINIVSDCLLFRYSSLMTAPFDTAEIHFRTNDNRHRPYLLVNKNYDEAGDLVSLNYSFWDYKTRKTPSFSHEIKSRYYRRGDDVSGAAIQRKISFELEKRFKITWLSLSRSSGSSKAKIESSSELKDRLDDSLRRLATYFTQLDSKFAEEMQKFQQEWFMSLLVGQKRDTSFYVANEIDPRTEGDQIREMLSGIGIAPNHYASKVDRHERAIRRVASERLSEDGSTDPIAYIADRYDISKLHFLVEQWSDLQKEKERIYATKTKFVQIANKMLFKKEIGVDSGNRVRIRRLDRKSPNDITAADYKNFRREVMRGNVVSPGEISHDSLSSGEKQLLIFLSETALRSADHYIFIADEPELSLHIEWQEALVPVILELSPHAQIFFATHSPDIVNGFSRNVFSMEEFLS